MLLSRPNRGAGCIAPTTRRLLPPAGKRLSAAHHASFYYKRPSPSIRGTRTRSGGHRGLYRTTAAGRRGRRSAIRTATITTCGSIPHAPPDIMIRRTMAGRRDAERRAHMVHALQSRPAEIYRWPPTTISPTGYTARSRTIPRSSCQTCRSRQAGRTARCRSGASGRDARRAHPAAIPRIPTTVYCACKGQYSR